MRHWRQARAAARRLVGTGAIIALLGNVVTMRWRLSPDGAVITSGAIALLVGGSLALVGLYPYAAAVDAAVDELDRRLAAKGATDANPGAAPDPARDIGSGSS